MNRSRERRHLAATHVSKASLVYGNQAMATNAEARSRRRGNRFRIAAWTIAALILLLPLIAMQFTDDVNWDAFDFAFMGALLGGVGLGFELAVRKSGNPAYRAAAGIALAAVFLLVWVNGAVGIIGEPGGPNLMYLGVLAVGIVGATIARFQPGGMARALFATALAQALVAVIALIGGLGSTGPIWPRDILMLTGFFAVLWLISAWLFQKAAREQAPAGAAP
jgi:hypothetical protein